MLSSESKLRVWNEKVRLFGFNYPFHSFSSLQSTALTFPFMSLLKLPVMDSLHGTLGGCKAMICGWPLSKWANYLIQPSLVHTKIIQYAKVESHPTSTRLWLLSTAVYLGYLSIKELSSCSSSWFWSCVLHIIEIKLRTHWKEILILLP